MSQGRHLLLAETDTRFALRNGASRSNAHRSLSAFSATLRKAAACSHGMQRRAEFARLVLTKPDLLLLDEAHAGLDPQAADLVAHLVAGVRSRGGAAIVVSHEHARIAPLVDRFVELQGGAVVETEWNGG